MYNTYREKGTSTPWSSWHLRHASRNNNISMLFDSQLHFPTRSTFLFLFPLYSWTFLSLSWFLPICMHAPDLDPAFIPAFYAFKVRSNISSSWDITSQIVFFLLPAPRSIITSTSRRNFSDPKASFAADKLRKQIETFLHLYLVSPDPNKRGKCGIIKRKRPIVSAVEQRPALIKRKSVHASGGHYVPRRWHGSRH